MDHGGTADDVEQQIASARQACEEATRLRLRIAAGKARLQECADGARSAREKLSSEGLDVARLESTVSWSRVLSTLRGTHATDLEREKAEWQAATYEYQVAAAREETAYQELVGYQSQLAALGDTDARYQQALAAKETWLDGVGESASRLALIAERRGALAAEAVEVKEAQAAGVRAHHQLKEAHKLLGKARDWADWDAFGGGGLFTDMMKYDRLDQAGSALRSVDAALATFSRELADVKVAGVEQVAADGLTRAFDVWFDNIFTDLKVRRRIIEAHQKVAAVMDRVVKTLAMLERRAAGLAAEDASLAGERERILTA